MLGCCVLARKRMERANFDIIKVNRHRYVFCITHFYCHESYYDTKIKSRFKLWLKMCNFAYTRKHSQIMCAKYSRITQVAQTWSPGGSTALQGFCEWNTRIFHVCHLLSLGLQGKINLACHFLLSLWLIVQQIVTNWWKEVCDWLIPLAAAPVDSMVVLWQVTEEEVHL